MVREVAADRGKVTTGRRLRVVARRSERGREQDGYEKSTPPSQRDWREVCHGGPLRGDATTLEGLSRASPRKLPALYRLPLPIRVRM